MIVKVKYFATVREIVRKKEEIMEFDEDCSVKRLLQILAEKYGPKFAQYVFDMDSGRPHANMQFLLDGKSVGTLDGLNTKLKGKSELAVMPPVGGG